jgi:ABC-type multidrug transport system ATPase subunit
LKKPRVLLLDEATSALDKVNEKIVQDAIDTYRKTRGDITTIVIAHRLSTIRDADKIVVLVNGVLKEMGNHDEIMANYPNGTYADFVAKQASSEANAAGPTTEERQKEDEINTEVEPEVEVAAKTESKEDAEKKKAVKRTNTKTVTDSSGRTTTITLDGTTVEMLEKADEIDAKAEDDLKEYLKPFREQSDFMKIF